MTYGTLTFEGVTYTMTAQAEPTNRVFPGWYADAKEGESYLSEWAASAVDASGNKYQIVWLFEQVRGAEQEPDSLNWDDVCWVKTA